MTTRYYETCFIARQDLGAAQVKELADKAVKIIEDRKGKIHKIEDWGQQTLAYRINKNRKGHYMLIEFEAPADAVLELNRVLGIDEEVLRYMTCKIDELSSEPSPLADKSSDEEAA